MKKYILSAEAAFELEEIYLDTFSGWGEAQADSYLHDLYHVFSLIGDNPNMGRLRNEIGKGIRSFPQGSHVIFFMEHENQIAIVRVLHGARDFKEIFDKYKPAV